MSFLAPWFLLGGLAVALPIMFHLIRRTSKERTIFGSIMFLRPGPPRMTRRNRIEDWLLLAMRCLVLVFLALAFARPFFMSAPEAGTSQRLGSRILVLMDRSASMQRQGLWAEAVGRIEAVAAELEPGDALAVWTFDRALNEVFDFGVWGEVPAGERRGWLRARLEGVTPGWGASWLDQALIEGAEVLAAAGGEEVGKERRVVVIGDLHEGNRLSGLQAHDWPAGVTVQLEPVGRQSGGNAGLHLVADSGISGDRGVRTVRVRVENSADSARDQFQVGWVRLAGREWMASPMEVYVPAGQSRVLAVAVPDGELGLEQLELRGDGVPFDNTLFVVPPVPRELRVVYLGSEDPEDPAEPLFFLRRAFRETARQVVRVEAFDPAGAVPMGVMDEAAMVVATGRLTEGWAERVRTAASAGVTVLLAPVDLAAAASQEACLGGLRAWAGEVVPGSYAMLGDLDFRHPWLGPFADPRFSDFTKIRFWRYRQLDEEQKGSGRVVARFEGGDVAVLDWPMGRGRVFVFAAGWHPRDSQLALSSKFVPLLYSLLELTGSLTQELAALEVGDELVVDAWARGGEGELVGPGGEVFSGSVLADRPGIYRWVDGDRERRWAVNLAASESRTTPLLSDDFEAIGVPLRAGAEEAEWAAGRLQRMQHAELERQQKVWWWLLAGTVGLLLVETWAGGRALRRAGQVNGGGDGDEGGGGGTRLKQEAI